MREKTYFHIFFVKIRAFLYKYSFHITEVGFGIDDFHRILFILSIIFNYTLRALSLSLVVLHLPEDVPTCYY